MSGHKSVTVFSPAKINLFLAVTGRRDDGYHDLASVAAPLDFGDQLSAEIGGQQSEVRDQRSAVEGQKANAEGMFALDCDFPDVPSDDGNLVIKAAKEFAAATGWREPVRFRLTKRIPPAAGLGGGSSNAVAAMQALNELSGGKTERDALAALAARLGSDCALFLHGGPVIVRGRGERIEPLPASAAQRLRGRRVLLFKPAFGIGTAWAYARLAAGAPKHYLPALEAENLLEAWIKGAAGAEELLFNSFEPPVFAKYLALPALRDRLRGEFGLAACLSGSGSACFALLPDEAPVEAVAACIRQAWGPAAFVQTAKIA